MLETTGHADHSFWYIFYTHLLEELGVQDDGLRDNLVEATRLSANWDSIRPGTCEALEQIGKRYRIGVISNSDGKVSDTLRVCGIADCFLSIIDSGVIGHEKPHSAIFQAALRELRARPEESLYVGERLLRRLCWRDSRRDGGHAVRCSRSIPREWAASRGIAG